MSDTKLGCYICSGCGIGDSLDIDALCEMAEEDDNTEADIVRRHEALCSDEGVALIKNDIDNEGVNAVVIGACSSRAKQKEFAPLSGVVLERASLREGVAWICEPQDEDGQLLAEDYLRMWCTKAKKSALPEPFAEGEFAKSILVVGGGVAGMTAALEAAKAGYETTLLEQQAELGGYAAKLHQSVPHRPPYHQLEDVGVGALIDQVRSQQGLTVLTEAEIEGIDGAPCKFEVKVKTGSKEVALKIGAIVLASGFTPYDASKLGHLGYGEHQDVVTSVELEAMVKAGELKRPSDGGAVNSVLFIQCAGSRDKDHLPYCSTVCCNTSLKQSLYLKQHNPAAQSYVLYKDMRTPGQGEEFYRQAQRDGTVFIRGELKEVAKPNGKLSAAMTDVLLGEDVQIEDLDLIVLATGMVSTNRLEGETNEPLSEEEVRAQPKILKLNYRQGPEVPALRYGMPDSHYICFPYETRRTGIFAAGTVRRSMDAAAAMRDGRGAALKAIQAVEVISRGEAVHPRVGDKTFPEFFMQRCTQCKRCTEECPFGAINEDEKGNPLPNPTRCRRCGICLGACPERIISFKNYTIDGIGSAIKSMEVPDEDEEKPCVLALVCENDALPVLDKLAQARTKLSPYIRVIPLRCAGSTNLIWIADALAKGIDGVLVLGCHHGDDYQCHFIKGSELCKTRLGNIKDTLERLVLEPERIRFEEISMNDGDKLTTVIEEFMETIEEVGPNPYKGF